MNSKGFTLIEMVVVVGILGFILVAVTTILFNSFRSQTRVSLADVVDQSGTLVLGELKNNIVSAVGVGISCATSGVGNSLALISADDGTVTTLVCYEGVKIASESANGNFDLTSSTVKVTGCSNFARCDLFPDSTDRVINVNFWFNLSAGDVAAGAEKFVGREFRSNVVVRN